MNKKRKDRATLRMRLHFLFTGEIPGYWYNAQADVMTSYLDFYVKKLEKAETPEEKKRIGNILDVFATHRFNKKQIQDHIPCNRKHYSGSEGCGNGQRYFNYFSKEWINLPVE